MAKPVIALIRRVFLHEVKGAGDSESFWKLKSEISSLQIPTDDIVWVLSDLVSISGAVENLFAGQSEFNQGGNFPAS